MINDPKRKGDKESILNHFNFDISTSAVSEYNFWLCFCGLRLLLIYWCESILNDEAIKIDFSWWTNHKQTGKITINYNKKRCINTLTERKRERERELFFRKYPKWQSVRRILVRCICENRIRVFSNLYTNPNKLYTQVMEVLHFR